MYYYSQVLKFWKKCYLDKLQYLMVSLTRKMTQTKNKAQAAILSLKMKCSHLKSLTTSVLSARMKCFQTITRRRICSTSSSFTIRGSTSWKIYRLKGIILRRERSLWYLLRPYSRKNLALTTWRRLKSTSTTKRLGWKRHQLVLVDLNKSMWCQRRGNILTMST